MRAIYKSLWILNTLVFISSTVLYVVAIIGINVLVGIADKHVVHYVFFYFATLLGVYAFQGNDFLKPFDVNRVFISTAAGVILAALVTIPFMLLLKPHPSKAIFSLLVMMTFGIAVLSSILGDFCFKKWVPSREIVVVGDVDKWGPTLDEVNKALQGKMKIVSWLNPTAESLIAIANNKNKTSVIVADPGYYTDETIKNALDWLKDKGCPVEMLSRVVEEALGRIPIHVAQAFKNYYEMAFHMVSPDPRQRVADIILSLIGIFIGLPIIVIIAIVIFIDSGFPILYKQKRVGKDGEVFTIHKFRTMRERENDEIGFADDHACYITRIGKVLRKTRLDEIPQLWDVLRGKMSLVGPRPEQPDFERQFAEEIPFYRYRRLVKPGITGWAQIRHPYAASVEETKKKLEYDLYYIKNRSLTLYLQIILWTVETILTMRGAR